MANDSYFYGQGRISIATRDKDGNPGAFRFVGDVSAFSLKLDIEKVEHKESYSGQKGLVRSFPIGKSATLDLTMHQVDTDNLALVLFGSKSDVEAGTVTDEALPDDLADGAEAFLKYHGVSDVEVKDSDTSPSTLTEGTDYTVDKDFGRITILATGSYKQPFTVSYSYKASKNVGMFTTGQPDLALRYDGYNLAEGNAPVIVNLYKVAPDPLQELALITDGNDVAGMQVSGGVLLDSTKAATGDLGQFGDIKQVAADA